MNPAEACDEPDPGRRATVLVTEDHALIRMEMCEYLRDAGFRVLEAADAEEALQVLRSSLEVAVLITDVRMPGECDGLGLAAIARERRPGIKVVIVSGDAADADARRLSDLFLRKPYNIGVLVEQVRALQGDSAP